MESLIYDRTLSDITNLTRKGQYNASDLNRVESWTNYLNDKFNEMGYKPKGELKYIESTGTQSINTGIVPNSKTRMRIKFKLNRTDVGQGMGWGSSGSQECFNIAFNPTYGFRTGVSSSYQLRFAKDTLDTEIHTFDLQSGSQKFDGIEYAKDTIGDTAIAGQTLYLFSHHAEWTTALDGPCYIDFYSCEIWQNGELVRDYIPDIDSNGVVAPFDRVTQTYFYNQGTGEFIAGYGEGYKQKENMKQYELEYIESTGTQYIDGISLSSNFRFEFDVMLYETTTYYNLYDATSSMLWITGENSPDGANKLELNAGSAKVDVTMNVRHKIVVDNTTSCVLSVDGVIKRTSTKVNNSLTYSLFNRNGSQCFKGRIYSVKIYDNGILVRDAIPDIDSNGVVAPFDRVTQTYLYNQGTGGFIAGFTNGAKLAYELRNFKDSSVFNINQHTTVSLVNAVTPISNTFLRLSKTQWEYPAVGFSLSNKPQLQFDGNVVACIAYKFTTDLNNPRVGWTSGTGGSSLWNCTSDAWNDCSMPKVNDWAIKRVKAGKSLYNTFKSGAFGFSLQRNSDNVILDIAGISFYDLTDEQYADDDFVNSLGVAGFGVPEIPFEWKYGDDFILEEADRIINNVSLLRGVIAMYEDTPVTPETIRFLDYIKANDIEKILFDINKLVENIIANYRYSNIFYSGEVGLD